MIVVTTWAVVRRRQNINKHNKIIKPMLANLWPRNDGMFTQELRMNRCRRHKSSPGWRLTGPPSSPLEALSHARAGGADHADGHVHPPTLCVAR
jgi:hypothetical protein